jgi:hypothetical protein
MPRPARGRLLLVAWNGADGAVVDALDRIGALPNTRTLTGPGGRCALDPCGPHPPAAAWWRALVTGMPPDRRGPAAARRARALWNIATLSALKSCIVAWPGEPVAERIEGTFVCADAFDEAADRASSARPWVHPQRLSQRMATLFVDPRELSRAETDPFVPYDSPLWRGRPGASLQVASALSQTFGIHNAATWLLANEPWDLALVCYPLIGRLASLHGAAMTEGTGVRHAIGLTHGAYRYLDLMLGRLIELAAPGTTVLQVGAASGLEEPFLMGRSAAGARLAARRLSVLDIVPTALSLLGLPAARDMPGTALPELTVASIDRIDGWSDSPGFCGMAPAHPELLALTPTP